MDSVDISLILPAFNEAASIERTIHEAASYFEARNLRYELIVSADGDDGTREKARALASAGLPVRVIGATTRRGKGRGIREAVAIAQGKIIGFSDADNKVPIEEYGKVEPWFQKNYDVVIGSRGFHESRIEQKQALYRQLGAKGFALLMHTVVGLPEIRDTQCGFKFFRGDVARDLFRRQRVDGYMFDVEILALARRLEYRIQQVPVRWRDDADSRLELFRGNLRNLMDVFKVRFSLRRMTNASSEAGVESADSVLEPGTRR